MSGLEDLYREIILDHYRSPRNRGELESPPAHRAEGFNPLCGDEVVLYVKLDGDVISDVKIGGQGCSISQSSGSMMSAAIIGKTVSEVQALSKTFKSMLSIHDEDEPELTEAEVAAAAAVDPVAGDTGAGADGDLVSKLGDLAALSGVANFPVRIKCATLPWNTLAQAISDAAAE